MLSAEGAAEQGEEMMAGGETSLAAVGCVTTSMIVEALPRKTVRRRISGPSCVVISCLEEGERRAAISATDRIAAGAGLPVGLGSRIHRAFGLALEIATALLVVAEIVIPFIGIVARYAFNRPLIWSDELTSLLFLWLAMLGTVLALRRGEHMRMTALVLSPLAPLTLVAARGRLS